MSGETSELRDQLSIDTPELVALHFPLAGAGSRCLALMVDMVLQVVAIVVLFILGALILPSLTSFAEASSKWAIAAMILIPFALQWGYFTLFEAFGGGRTPGKRLMKIRVLQQTGRPIGLFESMARNFVRIVDALPGVYGVGLVCIFITRKQQRLGDLVAGTLVIHERKVEAPMRNNIGSRSFTASLYDTPAVVQQIWPSGIAADQLARLSGETLQMIESFLARRLDLPPHVRASLAQKIVAQISGKMEHAKPAAVSDETFLEGVAHDRRGISQ